MTNLIKLIVVISLKSYHNKLRLLFNLYVSTTNEIFFLILRQTFDFAKIKSYFISSLNFIQSLPN